MKITSQLVRLLDEGAVLDAQLADTHVHIYVVVSEPNVDRVADIVPAERFEADGDIHVMAVAQAQDAQAMIEDVSLNVYDQDTVVFLCQDIAAKDAVLAELGLGRAQSQPH